MQDCRGEWGNNLMGGSGGSYGGGYSPRRYEEIMRESIDATRIAEFNNEVNTGMSELLSDYNDRDSAKVSEHLDRIKSIIEEDMGGTIGMSFGGSVKKHTYVDGLSDIDVIVTVDRSELIDLSPKEILAHIHSKLNNQLNDVERMKVGDLAVTIRFTDGMEIQLLPAIQTQTGLKIADMGSDKWSEIIKPERFASKLTEVNQSCGGRVIPVIKLIKGLIAGFPNNRQLTGYHIESMAIEVFENYPSSLPRAPKQMLEYFLNNASKLVKKPIKDKTGQSRHVDDYLGDSDSIQRQEISYTIDRVLNRMMNANQTASAEDWLRIVEGD